MQINEYQEWTQKTAIYPAQEALWYTALGLAGEAGEVANVVKKILRDDQGVLTPEKREKIIAELGDVLWYVARVAQEIKIPLETVLQLNHDKLESRLERGQLKGSGDYR